MSDDTAPRPEATATARVFVQRSKFTLEVACLAAALFAQSAGIVWWAAKTDARINNVEQTMKPLADGSLTSMIARIDERTAGMKDQLSRLSPAGR